MAQGILKRNNVHITGSGTQPMMFGHGFGCDQSMWRFVAPAFEDRFKVVLYDYVGCGKSDWDAYDPNRYDTLEGYARDVIEIARAADLKDIVYVGHSVSSMIALHASRLAPELFSRLVLLVPSACYINDPPDYVGGFERDDLEGLLDLMEKNFLGWASFLAPQVMGPENPPELTDELEHSFCSADPEISRRFARVTFLSDDRKNVIQFDPPPLIIQCADDVISPDGAIDYMHEHLPGSVVEKIPVGGHCPHMTHPQETIAIINEYLEQEGVSSGSSEPNG